MQKRSKIKKKRRREHPEKSDDGADNGKEVDVLVSALSSAPLVESEEGKEGG